MLDMESLQAIGGAGKPWQWLLSVQLQVKRRSIRAAQP